MKNRFVTMFFIVGTVLMVQVSGMPATGQDGRVVPSSVEELKLSFAPVVGEAAPAVVNIYTRKIVQGRRSGLFDDPIFRRFFGDRFSFGTPQARVQGALGSGVIVRPNGVVVTNHHVIEGADEITIVLADRREFAAEVLLADARTDLAILQLDVGGEQLPVLEFTNSDNIHVGDLVLAIGNPFGIGQTVTSGIVSATARTKVGVSDFGFFIQTDAAVNPGNSGGALVGLDGALLGINTAIYSRSGGSNGIGFAIPANMVNSVVRAALNEGELIRPWLGIRGQSVNATLATSLGLDRAGGVLIDAIYPGSPAALGGLNVGDVILAIGGKEVIDQAGLNFRIATLSKNDQIRLAVLHVGNLIEKELVLNTPPDTPAVDETLLKGDHPFKGVNVLNLNPRFNENENLDPFLEGILVKDVDRRSAAARYQFVRPGDIIVSLNGQLVETVNDLEQLLDSDFEQYRYRVIRARSLRECLIVPDRSFRCTSGR